MSCTRPTVFGSKPTADFIAEFMAFMDRMPMTFRSWVRERADDNEGAWSNEEILRSAEAVFAIWPDDSKIGGVGVIAVKGLRFLCSGNAGNRLHDITAIWCRDAAEAEALMTQHA